MRCRPARVLTVAGLMLASPCLVWSEFAAAGPDKAERQTAREMLSLLLTSPVGDQAPADRGPCTKTGSPRSVREDVIYFLAELSENGRVSATCALERGKRSCELRIGQAAPRREDIWTRTYIVTIDATTREVVAPVECYSIP